MRFFEYEAREIVKRAGIPVTKFGYATTPEEAEEIAREIGGQTVIKSQVLTGGRMKAGGIQFADTPGEAADHARECSPSRSAGTCPAACSSTPAQVKQEYYAGVVWDGVAKQPVMLFSDMGGIDIEEVAATHPDHVGRGHFANLLPLSDWQAKQVIASIGVTGTRLNRLDPDPRPPRPAVRRARHDARRDQPDRRARGRDVRRPRRPHGHGERGPPPAEGAARRARRRRRGDSPGPRGDALRAGRRGRRRPGPPGGGRERDRVRREPRPGDRGRRRVAHPVRRRPGPRRPAGQLLRDRRQPVGRQGLRPGQARPPEARGRADRRDDVDRLQHPGRHRRPRGDQGLRRARLRPGREDRHLPHPRGLGGRGLQDPREVRDRVRRSVGLDARGRPPGRGQGRSGAAA